MDKLQELTDRLYAEGLSKGKQEGEALLEKARQEADDIISQAKAEADSIRDTARREAEDYRSKVESDVRMASEKSLQATRKDIENLVVTSISSPAVDKAMTSEAFIKDALTAVAKGFSTEESKDIALVLPEALKSGLEPFVATELSKMLGRGVNATFSKKIAGGFRIGPKDGSYFVSMTDDTFKALMAEYLRPATRKLLFGDE